MTVVALLSVACSSTDDRNTASTAAATSSASSAAEDPVAASQARVDDAKAAVTAAEDALSSAHQNFCGATEGYIETLDRYGRVFTDSSATTVIAQMRRADRWREVPCTGVVNIIETFPWPSTPGRNVASCYRRDIIQIVRGLPGRPAVVPEPRPRTLGPALTSGKVIWGKTSRAIILYDRPERGLGLASASLILLVEPAILRPGVAGAPHLRLGAVGIVRRCGMLGPANSGRGCR